MKKLILFILFISSILSCTAQKTESDKKKGVGIEFKTNNPNTPYIYKNGYKSYEIKPILVVNGNDSTYVNELRFNEVFSSFYTQQLMFDNFGKWNKEIRPNNEQHPILVWEKVKLFKNEDKLYYVAAYGIESMEEIFAAVMVFDYENKDCFTENNEKKDLLIDYFSKGIIGLKSDPKFYKLYRKMVNEYTRKNKK